MRKREGMNINEVSETKIRKMIRKKGGKYEKQMRKKNGYKRLYKKIGLYIKGSKNH